MLFLFQCHALISDGSLALCTALEQFNLVYLKNKLYEGKLPYWLPLKWTADWLLLWWVRMGWLHEVSCAVVTASLRVRIFYRYGPFPRPTLIKDVWSRSDMIHPDFNIVFFWGGVGGVFVVASAFKSFILKLDVVTSSFLNIFVHDCR